MGMYKNIAFLTGEAVMDVVDADLVKFTEHTIYVDQNFGSDSNGGSFVRPVKTMQKAFDIAKDGCVIVVNTGVYDISMDNKINPNICVKGFSGNGGNVVFQGLLSFNASVKNISFYNILFRAPECLFFAQGVECSFFECFFDSDDGKNAINISAQDASGYLKFYNCEFNPKSLFVQEKNAKDFNVYFTGCLTKTPMLDLTKTGFYVVCEDCLTSCVGHQAGFLTIKNSTLFAVDSAGNVLLSSAEESVSNCLILLNVDIEKDISKKAIIGIVNKSGACVGFHSLIVSCEGFVHVLNNSKNLIPINSSHAATGSVLDNDAVLKIVNDSMKNIVAESVSIGNVGAKTGVVVADETGKLRVEYFNASASVESWTGKFAFDKKVFMIAKEITLSPSIPPLRIPNIEKILSFCGYISYNSQKFLAQNLPRNRNFISMIGPLVTFSYVGADAGDDALNNKPCMFIIEYTKK